MEPLACEDGFAYFARRQRPRLRRQAYLLSRDWQYADDLVQETLMVVYRHWHALSRHDELGGYTRTVMKRLFLHDRRAAWRERELLRDPMPEPPPARDRSDQVCERLALLSALSRLPRPHQRALLLRYWLDLPVQDIAGILRRPCGTVRSDLSRGLAAVRAVAG